MGNLLTTAAMVHLSFSPFSGMASTSVDTATVTDRVFFDLDFGYRAEHGLSPGSSPPPRLRVVFGLFGDVAPRTAANFLQLSRCATSSSDAVGVVDGVDETIPPPPVTYDEIDLLKEKDGFAGVDDHAVLPSASPVPLGSPVVRKAKSENDF